MKYLLRIFLFLLVFIGSIMGLFVLVPYTYLVAGPLWAGSVALVGICLILTFFIAAIDYSLTH